MIESRDDIVLVMEDFDGVSLRTFQHGTRVDSKTFLSIGVHLSDALASLFKHDLIHGDIRPDTIFINRETSIVKLGNAGLSTLLRKQRGNLYSDELVTTWLPYISPEQTGRMNRSVDWRSDLYSLGVVFYEMLSGEVPFRANDPLELIHAHIAREAVCLAEKNATIPPVISDIVMKLLAKNAGLVDRSGVNRSLALEP